MDYVGKKTQSPVTEAVLLLTRVSVSHSLRRDADIAGSCASHRPYRHAKFGADGHLSPAYTSSVAAKR